MDLQLILGCHFTSRGRFRIFGTLSEKYFLNNYVQALAYYRWTKMQFMSVQQSTLFEICTVAILQNSSIYYN